MSSLRDAFRLALEASKLSEKAEDAAKRGDYETAYQTQRDASTLRLQIIRILYSVKGKA